MQSNDDDKAQKALGDESQGRHSPEGSTYDVGYGKPPKPSQFKPGQSGNPRGRPRGSKNRPKPLSEFEHYLFEELEREHEVHNGGKVRKMNAKQIIASRLVASAAKGDAKAQKFVIDEMHRADQHRRESHAERWERLAEIKMDINTSWATYHAIWRHFGLPHPNTIVRDTEGGILFLEPLTPEERLDRFRLRQDLKAVEEALKLAEANDENTTRLKARRRRLETVLTGSDVNMAIHIDVIDADTHLLEWLQSAVPEAHYLADLFILLPSEELARFRELLTEHQAVVDQLFYLQSCDARASPSVRRQRRTAELRRKEEELLNALNQMDPRRLPLR